MKLVIKDEPREWRKFMLQFCGLGLLVSLLLLYRGVLTRAQLAVVDGVLLATALLAVVRPRWFRPFHRVSLAVSGWLGERMSKVILSILFFAAVTPLGIVLRLFKYDPLARRTSPADSYWRPVKRRSRLDRMH